MVGAGEETIFDISEEVGEGKEDELLPAGRFFLEETKSEMAMMIITTEIIGITILNNRLGFFVCTDLSGVLPLSFLFR